MESLHLPNFNYSYTYKCEKTRCSEANEEHCEKVNIKTACLLAIKQTHSDVTADNFDTYNKTKWCSKTHSLHIVYPHVWKFNLTINDAYKLTFSILHLHCKSHFPGMSIQFSSVFSSW